MQTNHKIFTADSRKMSVSDGSVDLVVTSPPYPMICQWDDAFVSINTLINDHLEHDDGMGAFDLMHKELYKTWAECNRVMKDGAIACINIGDACRTIGGRFRIFPNHYRVIENMLSLGFDQLPGIIWRKPTSSRTSYYGSGTLPVGAYVKYESEYILIFRKGKPRQFKSAKEKLLRRRSSMCWEERNDWCSDQWSINGVTQTGYGVAGKRLAVYPIEIPYRLICMYSVAETDFVLDPFLGIGTTTLAAMASGRNSIGIEICDDISKAAVKYILDNKYLANRRQHTRMYNHSEWARSNAIRCKYNGINIHNAVMTRQETDIVIPLIETVTAGTCGDMVELLVEHTYDRG
jgi:DNA modification methylase